jgi:hypothetical protein
MSRRVAFFTFVFALGCVIQGCGARTGTLSSDPHLRDASVDAAPTEGGPDANIDGGNDAGSDGGNDAGFDGGFDAGHDVGIDTNPDTGCMALPDGCSEAESCTSTADDDCDGMVDEGCDCEPGDVRDCFPGAPGRRSVGACTDGTETCEMTRSWGPCLGGIGPQPSVCDGRDNLCDGCSAQHDCPLDCPSPGDPRVADGTPFADYPLHGAQFYPGLARSWRWTISGGPCDTLAPSLHSYDLVGGTTSEPTFTPRLSGDYTITMQVVTVEGTTFDCSWVVHVSAPGLRIEMCYPESTTQDLDLAVHRPGSTAPWYPARGTAQQITTEACSWANCEATIRGDMSVYLRANWGYVRSPLSYCDNGPNGAQWTALGFCGNPRLDIDNNLAEGTGLPENINIDTPGDGELFRVMVDNWTGTIAHPVVNVYCDGHRIATYGAAPDTVPMFQGSVGSDAQGAMWRVVDVTTHVAADGTLTCDPVLLHPRGRTTGYNVTYNDGSY